MKNRIILFVASSVLVTTAVHAETVVSNSKYPVVLEVYKGTASCNPNEDNLTKAVKNVEASYKGTDGGILAKLASAVEQTINTTMRGSGCELIGKAVVVNQGEKTNVPAGARVVAWKDPLLAWQQDKKIVNPMPGVCNVKPGSTISFDTRNITGSMGDLGLRCTVK